MRRIESGNEALDQILGGGFPANSTNLLMGMPGTGKTVLAQSIAFHNASAARAVLYISTVSEPLDRMLRYVQEFAYFNPAEIGEAIIYQELSEPLRTRGLVAAIDEMVGLIKRYQPAFLVIDSFKALHSFTDSEQEFRASLSVLTSVLSSLAITSFWVGEYGADEIPALPEFAVTDSIIELVLDKVGVGDVRYLRVTKLRGSAFFGGEHAFRIGSDGIELFPRLTTPDVPVDYELAGARSAIGVPALDAMLPSGPLEGQLDAGFRPSRQRQDAARPALHLQGHRDGRERSDRHHAGEPRPSCSASPRASAGISRRPSPRVCSRSCTSRRSTSTSTSSSSRVSRRALHEGSQRVLIDSVNNLQAASPSGGRFRDFMYSLTQAMAVNGVSIFMTHEIGDLFATTVLSRQGISHMSDNVLLLSYVRADSQIRRAISVIKTRASDHDPSIRQFSITSDGFVLGEAFAELTGRGSS